MDLVFSSGFHSNCEGKITCVTKTSNTGAEPGFPLAGEREGGFHYLGTITHVTDASGNVVNEYNFDEWGRRRNFTDWSYNVVAQADILPDRGFTGNEYLLYNINGRLYDPVVGKFLSWARFYKTLRLARVITGKFIHNPKS